MKANGNPRSENAQPTVISSTKLQRQFGAILRRCYKDGEQFIVERDGLPVFVVLAVRDYERLMQLEPKDRKNDPPEP